MEILRRRRLAIASALLLAGGCHAVLGFEEGTLRDDVGAGPGSSGSVVASGSTSTGDATVTSSATVSGAGGEGGSRGEGGSGGDGGGAGGGGGEGGSGDGGAAPLPALCEAGEPWGIPRGDASSDAARITARIAPGDGVAIGGAFLRELDLGPGHVLDAGPSLEGFVAVLDDSHEAIFARLIGGSGGANGRAVLDVSIGMAGEIEGDVAAVGTFDGTLEIEGLDAATTDGMLDAFVAALTPEGDFAWRTIFTGPNDQRAIASAVVPGGVLVAGGTTGMTQIGDEMLDAGGVARGFVAQLDSVDGTVARAVLTSLAGPTVVQDFVVTGSGDVLLAHADGDNGFEKGGIVLIDSAADETWARAFDASVIAVAAGSQMMFAGGAFTGTFDPGPDDVPAVDSEGAADGFVARIDPMTGNVMWLERFGGADPDAVLGLAIGCDGRLLVSLAVESTLQIAGQTLAEAGDVDIVVARLDVDDGTAVSASRFGGDRDQLPLSLVARDAAPLLAGTFAGSIDFGTGPLVSQARSFFVVQAPLAPAGD